MTVCHPVRPMHIIDLGSRAGKNGGYLFGKQGHPRKLNQTVNLVTGKYLSLQGKKSHIKAPDVKEKELKFNAFVNNLKGINLHIPSGGSGCDHGRFRKLENLLLFLM